MNFTSAVLICKKNQLGKNTPAYNKYSAIPVQFNKRFKTDKKY